MKATKKFKLTEEHKEQLECVIEDIESGLWEDFADILSDLPTDENGEPDEILAEQRTEEFRELAIKYLIKRLKESI